MSRVVPFLDLAYRLLEINRLLGALLGLVVGPNIIELIKFFDNLLPLSYRQQNRLRLLIFIDNILRMKRKHPLPPIDAS